MRLGDEGRRQRAPAGSPAAPPARASRSTSRRSTRSPPTNVEPWVQVAFVGRRPRRAERGGRRAQHEPVVLQDGRQRAATAHVQPVERRRPGDPARRPHGVRGLAALAGGARAARTAWRSSASTRTAPTTRRTRATRACASKRMPAPTADGLVVFVESDAIGVDGARTAGRRSSQRRPLHTYRSLTGEADGLFRAPSPLPDGRRARGLATGLRRGPLRHLPLRPRDGRAREGPRGPGVALGAGEARRAARRCRTRARASCARTTPRARLYSIDVEHPGPGPTSCRRARRRRLRVVEGVAAAADRRAAVRRLLGEVPLAEDGSYQVQVPANTPVQLQLLDADGARAPHLGLALGAQPRRAGLRRLPRGPGAHAAEPARQGAPGAGARAEPAAREAPHARSDGRRGRDARRSASRRPTPAEVRAFVQSLDLGGQP